MKFSLLRFAPHDILLCPVYSPRNNSDYFTTLWHYATSRKVAGSIPDGITGTFHWLKPSGRTRGPGIDSASDRNEYQESFLGVKTAGA